MIDRFLTEIIKELKNRLRDIHPAATYRGMKIDPATGDVEFTIRILGYFPPKATA